MLLLTSCVVNKRTAYMQVDKHQEKQNSYQPMEYKDYQVMAGDELYINVLTFSQETNALLNPTVTTSGDNSLH